MPVDVSKFILSSFQGVMVGKPVSLCTTQFHQSKVLVLGIPWKSYPTSAVNVNINQGTTNPLDKLLGMFVDNTQNNGDITIIFPDTGYSQDVAAGTSKFVPIMAQTGIMNVFNQNLNAFNLTVATNIFLTNFVLDPFLSSGTERVIQLFQGSGVFPAGTQTFVTGVVGDNHLDLIASIVTNGTFPFLGVQAQPSFYVITNLSIAVFGVYCTGGSITGTLGFQDTTAAKPLVTIGLTLTTNMDYYPQRVLYQQSSEYIFFDATHVSSYFNNLGVAGGNGAVAGSFEISFDVAVIPSR